MYIIDGHNLIPKIPGLSLQHIDDEQQLIDLLNRFCAAQQQQVEVFFDKAPAGFATVRKYGRVTAHFVRASLIADDAIRGHLARLGKAARNVTVVSSDRQVQAEAHSRQAQVLSSEDFARGLLEFLPPAAAPRKKNAPRPAAEASRDEIEDWLNMFGGEPDEGVPPPKKRRKKKE